MSRRSYARRVDGTAPAPTRAERRDQATADTRATILAAARARLLRDGYASLSTRAVAETAGVPLSQIHYHFGASSDSSWRSSKPRTNGCSSGSGAMYGSPEPLWQQWERACDFLDEDLESGYVRVLQEMVAAGWSDAEVAAAVRGYLSGWYTLLAEVAEREAHRVGGLGPFTAAEVASLMGLPFMGAEADPAGPPRIRRPRPVGPAQGRRRPPGSRTGPA